MVVAGMAAHTDISRAQEIANEVRRINKQLKEAQTLAQTYNNRERLFGQPVTNVSRATIKVYYHLLTGTLFTGILFTMQ